MAFIEEWRLSIGHGDFLARFTAWAGAPYPETAELLSGLAGRHTLACLSNTNAAHWDSLSPDGRPEARAGAIRSPPTSSV